MKNATRRTTRAAKRAIIELDGLGARDKPLVLTPDNMNLFITTLAGCVYHNPKSEKYRQAQKRREQ